MTTAIAKRNRRAGAFARRAGASTCERTTHASGLATCNAFAFAERAAAGF